MRLALALVTVFALCMGTARAAEPAPAAPTLAGPAAAATAPGAAPEMAGWFEHLVAKVEAEAMSDVSMAPDVWTAIVREWRSFGEGGSAVATLVGIFWVALATIVSLSAGRAALRSLGRWPRRRMQLREDAPTVVDMAALIACDIAALAVFFIVFSALRRHVLPMAGVTEVLATFAAAALIRWQVVAVIVRVVLRPGDEIARLVDIPDAEARRLSRFLSGAVLAVILLVMFGRYSLLDEDSGAPHVIGLLIAVIVCAIYVAVVFQARAAAESLIRGRRATGMIAAARAGLARAWLPGGLILIAGLFLIFVAGLSLGLLSYYRAVSSTLGVLFIVLVLDRLSERIWREGDRPAGAAPLSPDALNARTVHRILRGSGAAVAGLVLASIWIEAIDVSAAAATAAMRSATAAVGTLLIAFVVWELVRLAIDRHLHATAGVAFPGADTEDETGTPASRLETILPLLRAAFGVVIFVLAVLIVLSRLGVDTAPLIAGAGVFGLAVSFGSQSLVRDIISGLFYMWDDAFRVGEYIDTGRLKGTVETLGVRSVKVRHQNGPLHTIPYGQLGAVTNLSRDFATIKFNMRFDPRTDIEVVRKTTKQLGLAMQEDHPELAAEIMQPLKLQGVAEIVDNAIVLRFKFTARPIKPSWVQREYLKRLYKAFAEKGIQFATGALFIQTMTPAAEAAPTAPPAAPAESGTLATATAAALGVAAALEVAALAEPAHDAAA